MKVYLNLYLVLNIRRNVDITERRTYGKTKQNNCVQCFGLDCSSAASPSSLSPSSWLPPVVLLLDGGVKDPLVVGDTPDMAKDDIRGEGNGSLISQVPWQMTKRIRLLELRWTRLPAMISHRLALLIVTGVGTASMDGEGVGCGDVGQVAHIHLGPIH